MRIALVALLALVVSGTSAFAACGKVHPEAKDKTQSSRPAQNPR